jgi:hypothetical protein
MGRWLVCSLIVALAAGAVQDKGKPDRAKLIGLAPAEVVERIGPPDDKEDLPDSNEAYWTYRTRAGTLTVHFQNSGVVDIDPPTFPVEMILK